METTSKEIAMKQSKNIELMVEDLIRKYPKGADGNLSKDDYKIDEVYTVTHSNYYNIAVTRDRDLELFQYSAESYAELQFMCEEVHPGLRSYLNYLYPDAGKRKISRRFNMLTYRLGRGFRRWSTKSGPATWKVDTDAPFPVYVIAGSCSAAEMLAKTMLSSNGIIPSYMYPKRYAPGNKETLSFLTVKLNSRIEDQIEYTKRTLEATEARLESYKSLSNSLESMGNAQLDILGD